MSMNTVSSAAATPAQPVSVPDLTQLRADVTAADKAYTDAHTEYHTKCLEQIREGAGSLISDKEVQKLYEAMAEPAVTLVAAINALLLHLKVAETDEIKALTIRRDRTLRHLVGPLACN